METPFVNREGAEQLFTFVQDYYWTLAFSAWFISAFFVAPIIWRILYHRFDVSPVARTTIAIGISAAIGAIFVFSAMRPFVAV